MCVFSFQVFCNNCYLLIQTSSVNDHSLFSALIEDKFITKKNGTVTIFFCLWWSSFENVDVLYFEEGKYINDVVLSYPVGLLSRHAKKISREKACQDEVIHCQDVIC